MPESAVQPQPVTGTTSTEPSVKPSLSLREKFRSLGQMVAWKSINRGMEAEDKQAARDADLYYGILSQQPVGNVEPSGDDDMGHMVLGDMKEIHNHIPQPSKGMGGLAKLALLAAGIASGGGAVAAIPLISQLLNPESPIVTPVVTPREPGKTTVMPGVDRDFRILKPRIIP